MVFYIILQWGGEINVDFQTYTPEGQKTVKKNYNYNCNDIKYLEEILAQK